MLPQIFFVIWSILFIIIFIIVHGICIYNKQNKDCLGIFRHTNLLQFIPAAAKGICSIKPSKHPSLWQHLILLINSKPVFHLKLRREKKKL